MLLYMIDKKNTNLIVFCKNQNWNIGLFVFVYSFRTLEYRAQSFK
jgi:hypothetical protein